MVEFEIMAQGLYAAEQVHVSYDPTQVLPHTQKIQDWMDMYWQQKLQSARERGIPLFDAPLFRLLSATSQDDQTLAIHLGNTSYKEYVTTRDAAFARQRSRHELSNALAVCSVVETSDGYILLDKRQGVDVYEGRYHVVGGFFERELDMSATHKTHPDPFAAIQREIREETGIQTSDIRAQYCLCVVYDLATPHAELCFLTQLHIPLAEALTRTAEDHEIKKLYPLHVSAERLRSFILEHHGHISATGEPNLLRYGAWKFGEEWYAQVMERIARHE